MSGVRVSVEWALVAVCALMSGLRRGRHRRRDAWLLSAMLVTVSVTGFALLVPSGRVFATVGSWRLTVGALLTGLHRSAVLTGMVCISKLVTSRGLRLPGAAGVFLSDVLRILDALTTERISFRRGHVIEAIDARLESAMTQQL